MDSLLNACRPAVFCPGCAHDQVLHSLDKALMELGFAGNEIAVVSDIGCSGLFDTFFNTHAFHGLHGRALTYATGIKMAKPNLKVIVTMGDGGLGIGGAHVLSTCRRNIDLTLLVLNNFNYGMTGGQCSSTTPQDAVVRSGFLNRLEKPMDICQIAGAAGAPYVSRISTYDKGLVDELKTAITFEGFSLVDIWGICPGRYLRHNKLTPKDIQTRMATLPELKGFKKQNEREAYGKAYRREAAKQKLPAGPLKIEKTVDSPQSGRSEIVLLGSAGQGILTAGELLCLAGASAGCHVTQKKDYPITVMRGHSVSEIILSDVEIDYTGVENPALVVALAAEGVKRREKMFASLSQETVVIKAAGVELPTTPAKVVDIDFKNKKIKPQDYALAALAVIARQNRVMSISMLYAALKLRFKQSIYTTATSVVGKIIPNVA